MGFKLKGDEDNAIKPNSSKALSQVGEDNITGSAGIVEVVEEGGKSAVIAAPKKEPDPNFGLQIVARKAPTHFEEISLERVEQLAAIWTPEVTIAAMVGCSERSFRTWKKDHPELENALRVGRALASVKLAQVADYKIQHRELIPFVIGSKQPPERGGLGWIDENSKQPIGKLEVVVTHKVFGPPNQQQKPAIDITPEPARLEGPDGEL